MPTRSVISAIAVEAESPRELCCNFANELSVLSPRDGLTLRPSDSSSPQTCLWWAVPTPEWPAFHLPKLFVDWLHPDDHSTLYFGLHVEKGLGAPADQPGRTGSRLVMDAGWAWQRFMNDLASGQIGRLVVAVRSSAVPSLYLRIEVSDEIRADETFPHERRLWRDGTYYGFECRGRDARLRLLYAHDDHKRGTPLERVRTLPKLAAALERLPDAPRRWVDLQLGVGVVIWEHGMSVKPIALKDLVARHIEPFAAWAAGISVIDRERADEG